jgi:hypothetical protein
VCVQLRGLECLFSLHYVKELNRIQSLWRSESVVSVVKNHCNFLLGLRRTDDPLLVHVRDRDSVRLM